MRNKFYTLFIVIFIGAGIHTVYGQQDAQFSQYMFNKIFYNPAYAGVEGVTKFSFLHRSQWAGYNPSFGDKGGAPNTQQFSLNTPILRLRSGAGFHIVRDKLGPYNNIEMLASYAYHIGIENAKISFGVRAGIISQTLDFGSLRFENPNDPLNLEGKESQVRPDMAVGIFLQSEQFYAGLSANHILKSEFDFALDSMRNALENNMTFMAGYDYEFNYNLIITPSVLVKTDLNSYSFDASVIGTYDEKLWAGLSFRQGDAAIALLGYKFLKDNSLSVGYAFDYIIEGQAAKSTTSHEFLLSYTLPVASAGGKKIIRTPRFRH